MRRTCTAFPLSERGGPGQENTSTPISLIIISRKYADKINRDWNTMHGDIISVDRGSGIMKKSAMCLVCGAFLALAGMQLNAQEAPKEAANEASGKSLGAVADDIKFENALQFYSMGDYRKALQMFNEYLEIYLTGAHRGEALRHVALIHFDRFEYEKSVRAYTAIHEESNNTEEGIEAYYKTGICYQKMGYDTRAQGVFQSIIEQYPYSTYAYLSRIQIDLLKIIEK
ncbi:MAG: hypothetical protein EHM32_07490 [Spirochaetales bacterium]|nr:MAG: hypothetical protein EHM32_07490 [Spirochaetales bacterium]